MELRLSITAFDLMFSGVEMDTSNIKKANTNRYKLRNWIVVERECPPV